MEQAQQAAGQARLEGKRRVGPASDAAKQGVDHAQLGVEQGAGQGADFAAQQVVPCTSSYAIKTPFASLTESTCTEICIVQWCNLERMISDSAR